MHVPHHGFADRVALIANDRAFGHLHPLALDRNPIGAGANVIRCAMPVRNIATGHAVRRDHALEPGADVRRHMIELALSTASAALASTERQASKTNGASLRIRSSAPVCPVLAGTPPAIRKS